MKKILLMLAILLFFGCSVERKPVNDMFPQMSYLEVWNGGTLISTYTGNITVEMGSMKNVNIFGEDFVLEIYNIYIDGVYMDTFVDSEAMAFRFHKR